MLIRAGGAPGRGARATLAIVDSWGSSHLTLGQAEREQIVALARLVPTVLVTGRAWTERVSAADLGLVALVPKPFDLQALLDVVRARPCLDQPPAAPEQARAARAQAAGSWGAPGG